VSGSKTKKGGQNDGSIYWLEDKQLWCVCVSFDYEGGKRKRKYVYGRTREDVQRKRNALLYDRDQGLPLTDNRITVGQYLDRWLEDVVKRDLRPSTYARYAERIRLHIAPELGRIPLVKLTPEDVRRFLNRKGREGSLKPVSANYLHRILRSALTQAVKWELVRRNVAGLVEELRVEKVNRQVLDIDQAKTFLAAVKGNRLEALYTVGFACGLRRGEALGLTWDDIDLDGGTLTVRRELQRIEGKHRLVPYAKTQSSLRTITLPEPALDALREQRERQLQMRRECGSAWQGESWNLVFATGIGTPLDGRNVLRYFQNALKQAGLPHQRFHDMRHACASLLLAMGVPDHVVMSILGHSSISITKNIYGHVYPSMQREAADKMGHALFGTNPEK
jgi:integrase